MTVLLLPIVCRCRRLDEESKDSSIAENGRNQSRSTNGGKVSGPENLQVYRMLTEMKFFWWVHVCRLFIYGYGVRCPLGSSSVT